jgi:hypothetical protein
MTTLVLLVASLAFAQAPNTLSKAEKSAGWQLLFDGKSMNGWESHNGGDWKIEKGAIVCTGAKPGWLGTSQSFSDYHLKLEFLPETEKTNSGIFLRSQKEGQPHLTGYELQVWDFQPAGFHTGSLVGTAKASATKVKPGVWNQYDVLAQGDHFVITLNGAKLLDTKDAKHAAGVIGFQCQKDNHIQFRNIKLLPKK